MPTPRFLNVDLDIESKRELTGLQSELGENVTVLVGGPVTPGCFQLRLEVLPEHDNPDDTILALCSLLENLSASGKRAWRTAHKKEFDIGHELATSGLASPFSLRNETLRRVAKLGATMGVTFYHHTRSKSSANKRKRARI